MTEMHSRHPPAGRVEELKAKMAIPKEEAEFLEEIIPMQSSGD